MKIEQQKSPLLRAFVGLFVVCGKVGAQTPWLSEAVEIDNSIKTSIEELEMVLAAQPAGP